MSVFNIRHHSLLAACLVLMLSKYCPAFEPPQSANPGVDDTNILLGMSNALSGPTAQLGIELREGALAYFNRVNQGGGIHGRQVRIISSDDKYEPVNTVANTRQFMLNEPVFALFGYVGTPTSFAIMPLLSNSDMPYLMPFTGAEFLRHPVQANIYNLRASYYQEAKTQIDYLVDELKLSKIGLLIQADEFGLQVEQGLLQALLAHQLKPVVTTRYRRNSEDINKALKTLQQHQVQAVSFVGTYQPFSELINLAYQQHFTPFYSTVSFVSSSNLFSRLKYPVSVLVTEVVPDPQLCQNKLCQQFRQDMQQAGTKELTRVQFEGYLDAIVFSEAAKSCGRELTRQCLLDKLQTLHLDLAGLKIQFSAKQHQGLDKVYLSFYRP